MVEGQRGAIKAEELHGHSVACLAVSSSPLLTWKAQARSFVLFCSQLLSLPW